MIATQSLGGEGNIASNLSRGRVAIQILKVSGFGFDSAFRNPCLREAASAKAGEIRNILLNHPVRLLQQVRRDNRALCTGGFLVNQKKHFFSGIPGDIAGLFPF